MSQIEKEEPAKDAANKVYDAVRNLIGELPGSGAPLSAPTAYSVLGNLKLANGSMMRDLLAGLAEYLGRSLIDLDNYADDGSNPAHSIQIANDHIRKAAVLADRLGNELSAAQTAINNIGFREPGDIGYRKPEDRK